MYKNFVSSLYVINIVFQAIFTLLITPLIFFLINYLCIRNFSFPTWSYAISLTVGFVIGLTSMIKFVISASEALERLEKQRKTEKDDSL